MQKDESRRYKHSLKIKSLFTPLDKIISMQKAILFLMKFLLPAFWDMFR